MQDRYTGDVGDYGKYGLLRALSGLTPRASPELKLGVLWYLTDEVMEQADPSGDGRHIGYLSDRSSRRFRHCDPDLYDSLGSLIDSDDRRVSAVRQRQLLGSTARFYERRLHTPALGEGRNARLERRRRWIEDATSALSGCDLVFLDPDNGLETRSVRPHDKKAPKYVYLDDLDGLWRGRGLVIYHHLARQPAEEQIRGWARKLEDDLGLPEPVFALRFHRGTGRAYFILASSELRRLLRERSQALLDGPWGQNGHFSLIE